MTRTHSAPQVLAKAEELPTISATATKLIKLVSDPNLSRVHVAELINLDEVLSANIFKYANSAAVGARVTFTNMIDVIDYIGINAIKNLVLMMASKQVVKDHNMWMRSVFISVTCSKICDLLDEDRESSDLSFMHALFHNLGSLVYRVHYPADYQLVEVMKEPMEKLKLEKKIFGINHLELSAKILEKWQFSDNLLDIILRHQDYQKFTRANTLVELCCSLFELEEVSDLTIRATMKEGELGKLLKKYKLEDLKLTEDKVNEFFEEAEARVSAW